MQSSLAWQGEHGIEIVGYRPPKDLTDPEIEKDDREEWEQHEGFFEEIQLGELYEGSSSRLNVDTFSGINLSTLNTNSLITHGRIKARKQIRQELNQNHIVCLQDVRIRKDDFKKHNT